MESIFTEAPPLPKEDRRLIELYEEAGRTLDDLPYTDDFDQLIALVRSEGDRRDKPELWHRLTNLRKAGRLPRLGRSSTPAVEMSANEEEILTDLIAQQVSTMGQRDRLPYTPEFENLVREFNRAMRRSLDEHDVWRLIARIAK